MKKLQNLKNAKTLSGKQQKEITGGLTFPGDFRFCCGCIVQGSHGNLEIIHVSCAIDCPDGTPSVSGLGC